MHNTVSIDGQEQVGLLDTNLFSVKDFNEVEKMEIKEIKDEICVSGSRKWKLPSDLNTSHTRKMKLKSETGIEVLDEIRCDSEHNFVWHFYLAPEISPEIIANDTVVLRGSNNSVLNVCFSSSNNFLVEIVDCEISPSYGVLISSKSIRISMQASSNFSFFTKAHY
jgi:hypothetical protein